MTLLTTPERRRQKPGPKINPTHFPCGCVRSPANTVTVGTTAKCRTCEQRRRNKNQRAVHAAVKPAKGRHYVPKRKPWIQPTPRVQALIEEARVEFNRLYGTPDSTDPAQLAADFGGEG